MKSRAELLQDIVVSRYVENAVQVFATGYDAEEAVQDVYLKLCELPTDKLAKMANKNAIFIIVRNYFIDKQRHAKKNLLQLIDNRAVDSEQD